MKCIYWVICVIDELAIVFVSKVVLLQFVKSIYVDNVCFLLCILVKKRSMFSWLHLGVRGHGENTPLICTCILFYKKGRAHLSKRFFN